MKKTTDPEIKNYQPGLGKKIAIDDETHFIKKQNDYRQYDWFA